jgi:methyl-accepting chemotaxis protein
MRATLEALDRSHAVIEFELDGTIIRANDNFLGAVGYELHEIVGRHHRLFVDDEYAASDEYAEFWRILGSGRFHAAQYRRIANGGREIWIEATYNPMFDRQGRPYKVVKYATDITELKREQADLRGRVEAISKALAVIEFELDGTIVTANENFTATVGYDLHEIVGRHHRMFVTPEHAASEEYADLWRTLRRGVFHQGQYHRVGKGGRDIWIDATYNPIYDANGKPVRVVKFASNITDQVVMRRQLMALVDRNMLQIEHAALRAVDRVDDVSRAASATTGNVQTMAGGADQLAASVGEIAHHMAQSRQAADVASESTRTVSAATGRLSKVAASLGGIVELISDIANQINLLALNATIEAARAGEAGRGFAVVANEVKNLAKQAADATDQISQEIQGMRSVSDEVVDAIEVISASIETVRASVNTSATAVEQQSHVTATMSENMRDASGVIASIGASIEGIRTEVAATVDCVSEARHAAAELTS